MTQNTLATHVQKSQEALTALLKKLLGTEVPLEAASPEHVSQERSSALHEDAADHFCLEAPEHDTLIALAPEWVPVLSEAMLGESLEAGAEGTPDLMQEVGSQAFGTVQSTLAAEGLELPGIQFEIAEIGTAPSAPDGPSWQVSFSAEHEGTALDGFVLVPAEEQSSNDSSAGQSFAERNSSEAASTQQASAPSSGADADSEVDVAPASFSDLGEEDLGGSEGAGGFELLAEVNLEVRVELGRRELPLADVLKLTTGSVVELEKMVGEPLSVYANGRLIAEGEAVVIDEQFGVRITNLASESSRDKAFF
jgi:flagellar motor switch protein FliN/FliY